MKKTLCLLLSALMLLTLFPSALSEAAEPPTEAVEPAAAEEAATEPSTVNETEATEPPMEDEAPEASPDAETPAESAPVEASVEESEPIELDGGEASPELPAPEGEPEADPEVEANAGDLPIDAAHFPDPIFRQYVKDTFAGGGDALSEEARLDVTGIDVVDYGISNLTGIEHFPNLTALNCNYNSLTALDVSHNTALEILECGGNDIEVLDVSMLPKLTTLFVDQSRIKSLDTRSNPDLVDLQCATTDITSLDVSYNRKLRNLSCSDNPLGTLDLSQNTELERLGCWKNSLTALDLSHCPRLWELHCEYNDIEALDLSHNPRLEFTICYSNPLATLTLGSHPDMRWLDCRNCVSLTRLSLDGCPNLKFLACFSTGLTELDIRSNIFIIRAYLQGTKTALSDNISVYSWTGPDGDSNELSVDNATTILYQREDPSDIAIDEARFPDPALRRYVLDNIDVTGDDRLSSQEIANVEELHLNGLGIARMDGVEIFTGLWGLYCEDNGISTLNLSALSALEILRCGNNELTALDISHNPALQELDISGNPMTVINISECPRLLKAYRDGYHTDEPSEGWIKYWYDLMEEGGITTYLLRIDDSDAVLTADTETVTISRNMKYTAYVHRPFRLVPGSGFELLGYATDHDEVASVRPSGMVSPNSVGKAKITVQVLKGGRTKKLALTLTVKDPTMPEKLALKKRGTLTVDLAKTPSVNLRELITVEPNTASGARFDYATTSRAVKITDDGLLTYIPGEKLGNVTVKVAAKNNRRAKLSIKLKLTDSSLPTGIKLDPKSAQKLTLGGDPLTLKAVLTPATAVADVTWASTNEAVATVQDGVVTAHSLGKATISATVSTARGKKTAKLKVTVIQPK